jgi:hypothetical protein
MADLEFNGDHLYKLTNELGPVAKRLDKQEWSLLLAIFAAAADHVKSSPDKSVGRLVTPQLKGNEKMVTYPTRAGVDKLRKQLRRAFVPGGPPSSFDDRVTPPKP